MVSKTETISIDWDAFLSEQKIKNAVANKDIQACVKLFVSTVLKEKITEDIKLKIGCRLMLQVSPRKYEKIAAALDERNLWPSQQTIHGNTFALQTVLDSALEEALKAKNLLSAKRFLLNSTLHLSAKYRRWGDLLQMILAHFPNQELIPLALERIPAWRALKPQDKALLLKAETYQIPLLSSFAKLCSTLPSKYLPGIGLLIQRVTGTPDQFDKASESEQARLTEELNSFAIALGCVIDCNTRLSIEYIIQQLIETPSKRRLKVAEAVKLIGFCNEDDLQLNFAIAAQLSDKKLVKSIEFLDRALDCMELTADSLRIIPVVTKREILGMNCDLSSLITFCHQHANPKPDQPWIGHKEVQYIVLCASTLSSQRRKKICRALHECDFYWSYSRSKRSTALEFFSRISDLEIELIVKFCIESNRIDYHGGYHEQLFESFYKIPDGKILEVMQYCLKVMPSEKFQADLLIKDVCDLLQEKGRLS